MDTKKLRQKILDLAIHGKLVPQDPNDEPASVLLERIKAEKERLIKEGKIKGSKKSAKASDTPHYRQILPEGWCVTNIGELLINRDGERKPVSMAIRSKQINKIYDYYGAAGVIDKVDSYLFEERLLLVGEDGANLLSRNKNNAFLADGKYWVNNHAHVLDAIDKFILSYVAIVINSMKLDDYITGSAQPKLSQDNLNKIPIFLPPLDEQKRIMAELEQWFTIIDKIEQGKIDLQTTIKQAKSKILDLAIHGKLVSQDPNEEPAIELLKRINPDFTPCDNGHSKKLPNGWTYCRLCDVLQITMGQSPKGDSINKNKGIEFHQGKLCFTNKYLQSSNTFTTEPTKLAEANSILLCVRAPVGIVNISPRKICIGRGLCSLKPRKGNIDFYFYLLQTLKESFEKQATGTTFKAISGDIVKNEIIILPPFLEQQRIVAKIEELFSVLNNIQNALEA